MSGLLSGFVTVVMRSQRPSRELPARRCRLTGTSPGPVSESVTAALSGGGTRPWKGPPLLSSHGCWCATRGSRSGKRTAFVQEYLLQSISRWTWKGNYESFALQGVPRRRPCSSPLFTGEPTRPREAKEPRRGRAASWWQGRDGRQDSCF